MELHRKVLFVFYAIVSYIYKWVITFVILMFMSRFLKPYKLGVVSNMLALAAAGSLAGWPLYRLAKNLHKRGRLPDMNSARVTLSAIAVAAIILFLFLVPLPVSRVRERGLVEIKPGKVEMAVVSAPGILKELRVQDGQPVQKGDVLAVFRDIELENKLLDTRTERELASLNARELQTELAKAELGPDQRAQLDSKLEQARGDYAKYSGLYEVEQIFASKLELRAPCDGVVMSPPQVDDVGKHFEQGMVFCSVGDPRSLRVRMPVSPADYRLLETDLKASDGLPVDIRVQGRAERTWHGRVSYLPQSEAKEIPVQLTNKGGGSIAVKPTSKPGHYQPQSQQYLVEFDILDPDRAICPGTMAQVKVHCKWRTCAWWVWRAFSSAFDLGIDPGDLIPARFRSK